MEGLFLRFLSLSLSSTIILLPLLLCGKLLGRRYAARTQYVVWLLMGVRLLVPVQFSLPQAPITLSAPMYRLDLPAVIAGGMMSDPVGVAAPTVQSVTLTAALAAVWAVGVAVFLLVQVGGYLLIRRRFLHRAVLDSTVAAPVRVYRSGRVDTPMTLGFLRPVLVLPDRYLDPETLDVMLRHELYHLRRRDVRYKAFLLLANALHWFNPAVWLMAREAGRNLEFCCDDEVLRDADHAQRRRYGEVLLNTAAAGRAPVLGTRFGSPKGELKERLRNLFTEKKTGAVLICVLAIAILAVGLLVVFRPTVEAPTIPTPEIVASIPDAIDNDSAANLIDMAPRPFGVDFPAVDYASENLVILHDYWGLVVFDLRQGQIVRALDTMAIDMNHIQGDQYTEITVSDDLSQILLSYISMNAPEDTAYLYLLEEDKLLTTTVGAQKLSRAVSTAEAELVFAEGEADPIMQNLILRVKLDEIWKEYPLFRSQNGGWLWPVKGMYTITQTCGPRIHPITGKESDHTGTDIAALAGTEVRAARTGIVVEEGFDKGWGNFVKVSHGDGLETFYSQLTDYTVKVGEEVMGGQVIGTVGSTGSVTGPHLHFEFRVNGTCGDALDYYPELEELFLYS